MQSNVTDPLPAWEYLVDSWQRALLTLDTLRERGNLYVEHAQSGKPPVLAFEHEVIMDARDFPRPANYALARIVPGAGHPPTDPLKRPFVVIDPRAGHGPGIGGFKIDSEIGIALRAGHPCYFVMFYPEPLPGQTLGCIASAEIAFMREVNRRHPDTVGQPFVIGNCQGGWALMILAAAAPELVGPLLLAGSPISYWAGVRGKHPMRYSGGLLGGTWLASLAGDLGHGKFDGSHLVTNFEQLDLANTYWAKLYNLYAKVDTERQRFLEFERWWGGHFLLNKAEMEWITQNLFVGNRLTAGEVTTAEGDYRLDLRRIRTPIVVFASWGDNITPPQQALNWILDLYRDVADLRAQQQTIVYCLHEKVGHLGIFVSAGVAAREHAEIASALDLIDMLPPGLYEAVIEDAADDMPGRALVEGRHLIRFEPRDFADIEALDDGREDEEPFEVVRRVSEVNQALYDTFASPWLRSLVNEPLARTIRGLAPPRLERVLLSDLNPWLAPVTWAAQLVRQHRQAAAADNPWLGLERQASQAIEQALEGLREVRDTLQEQLFYAIYESPALAAMVGVQPGSARRRRAHGASGADEEVMRLRREQAEAWFEQGTPLAGLLRVLAHTGAGAHMADERWFNRLRAFRDEHHVPHREAFRALKTEARRQAYLLQLDRERAMAALPRLLPQEAQRRQALAVATELLQAIGRHEGEAGRRLAALAVTLGVPDACAPPTAAVPQVLPAPRRTSSRLGTPS